MTPEDFAAELARRENRRAMISWAPGAAAPQVSDPAWQELADALHRGEPDYDRHEAIFLEVGRETGALFGGFLHRTLRGQGQGGLRHWPYPELGDFLRDGLRLSRGMGRKNALAGLWWGGGKGVIARVPGDAWRDADYRRTLFREYGRFTTSLRGCYITAEDAGTTPDDMRVLHEATRFATCVPEDVGGSGNPSPMTAAGVVCAMEAALAFQGRASLAGKKVAMQGTGHVSFAMIGELLERGVAHIHASEISAESRGRVLSHYPADRVEVDLVDPGDESIFAIPCDVLAPNALGGVIGPSTIPKLRTQLVCGAANNILEDDERDGRALEDRGITLVPDYIANRMGIVTCCDEQAGHLEPDPAVLRHFEAEDPASIQRSVVRTLERARDAGTTPTEAANTLADEAMNEPHPIYGDRCQRIIAGLARDWAC